MSDNSLTPIRIFVACPGDVLEEKCRVEKMIAILQKTAERRGLILLPIEWRQCGPNMGRPQGVILDQLNPESWDIVICILWSRLGTPSGGIDPDTGNEFPSGTVEEFKIALTLFRQRQRPKIFVYRGMHLMDPKNVDGEQFAGVQRFFSNFGPGKAFAGLLKEYKGPDEFQTLLHEDLSNWIDTRAASSPRTTGTPHPETIVSPMLTRPLGRNVCLSARQPNQSFTGREQALAELNHGKDRVVDPLRDISAIVGLGGQGKTTLAMEYAWRQRDFIGAFLFLAADRASAFDNSLAELAGPAWLNFDLSEGSSSLDRRDAVLAWLRNEPPDLRLHDLPWLLVIDNVDEPATADLLKQHMSSFYGGQVVITGRYHPWAKPVRSIHLDSWAADEVIAFLRGRIPSDAATPEQMSQLAQELGCLPLALEQAAAYLEVHVQTVAKYLELLKVAQKELLQFKIETSTVPTDEALTDEASAALRLARHAVATTWLISRNQCGTISQNVLRLAAFFCPEPIPRELLVDPKAMAVAFTYGSEHGQDLMDEATVALVKNPSTSLENAITELYRHSLIGLSLQSVTVHRLVQATERSCLSTDDQSIWFYRALKTCSVWLDSEHNEVSADAENSWIALEAHIEALLTSLPTSTFRVEPWLAHLLLGFGSFLSDLPGDDPRLLRAKKWLLEAINLYRQLPGPPQENFVIALNNLAWMHADRGSSAEAEPLYREALMLSEVIDGPNNSRTAISMHNLAVVLAEMGRTSEAETLLRKALAIAHLDAGAAAPHRLPFRLHALGCFLHGTGRPEEAELLLRNALEVATSEPNTATSEIASYQNDLAGVLVSPGKIVEAQTLCLEALEKREEIFGGAHREVGYSYSVLARLRKAQGHRDDAQTASLRAIQIWETTLRSEHPDLTREKRWLTDLMKADSDFDTQAVSAVGASHIAKEKRNTRTSFSHTQKLELTIPGMNSDAAQITVKIALNKLPGIISVRLMRGGAVVRFNRSKIGRDEIWQVIRNAGFRVTNFQDAGPD